MNACYCLCGVHGAFATVRCRGDAETTVIITSAVAPPREVAMCKPCAKWWEESSLRVAKPPSRQPRLDSAAFYRAIQREMRGRKITSNRQVSKETRLSPNVLVRLRRGEGPDTKSLIRLLCWMDWPDLDDFITYEEVP